MAEEAFNHYKEYTSTEEPWGYWIDGKVIYRKTVDIGSLPNATSKTVPHGVSDLENVIKIEGWAVRSSTDDFFPLPFTSKIAEYSIVITVTPTNIAIDCGVDRTNLDGYVTIYYTKTEASS